MISEHMYSVLISSYEHFSEQEPVLKWITQKDAMLETKVRLAMPVFHNIQFQE